MENLTFFQRYLRNPRNGLANALAFFLFFYLDVSVTRARDEQVSVRVEVDETYVGLVPGESSNDFGSFKVPNFDGARQRPGANELLGRAEPNAFDGRRVAIQGLQNEARMYH